MSKKFDYLLSRRFETYKKPGHVSPVSEHDYSTTADWTCSSLTLPTVYLFTSEECRHFRNYHLFKDETNKLEVDDDDEDGDVSDIEITETPFYDENKAFSAMKECEKYAGFANVDNDEDEENIYHKSSWCKEEKILYKKVLEILKSNRLSRLAYKGLSNETILCRISVNSSLARLRRLLTSVKWDPSIISKLHMNLITHLRKEFLGIYLDLLQTLVFKSRKLASSMMKTHMSKLSVTATEALDLLLCVPWDPTRSYIRQQPLPFSSNSPLPIFFFCRDCPRSLETTEFRKRRKFLTSQLSALGHLHVTLTFDDIMEGGGEEDSGELFGFCLAKAARKLREVKLSNPGSPVIVVGRSWTSLLACEVSVKENVDVVICLGFPTVGRQKNDPALQSDQPTGTGVPTLFIIGQKATNCSVEDLEEHRRSIQALTGLVVIGEADENLLVDHSCQMNEEVNQIVVDRCILEKIGQFLSHALKNHSSLKSD